MGLSMWHYYQYATSASGMVSAIEQTAPAGGGSLEVFGFEGGGMNVLVTLIIGGVVGWLASILMKTNAQMGIVANVIIGIIGSFLGSAIAGSLGVSVHDTPGSWIVAVLGASLLIVILRSLGVMSKLPAWR